ncbi:MAG: hypothetical protein EOP84_24435 [Verrucomicrobiaceae bacterium]|nr:MAG: hypothetical protein EOP84_24435 [Verrucomicrobiaceae bacterium]
MNFTSSRIFLSTILWLCLSLSTQAQVRRAEVIAIADSYLLFNWQPTAANIFHGKDVDGVQVDTPDTSFSRPGIRPGWWKPGKMNQGMPYMWGGFSTPEEFTRGIQQGKYAGDVYTAQKRSQGDHAVSKHAVGIDCSGFVSRCWKLTRAYSTKELPSLCVPLTSFSDLRPGDILNSADNHVLIFKAFKDANKERILAYEAGSPPTWKVLINDIPLSMLREQNYQPLRYSRIRD